MVDIDTIIKAYKFCKNNEGTCDKCSYFPKKSKLYGCPINNDMLSAIREQQAEIDRLKAEQPKKGHWEMKFRHHKSVRHVKGYDAYDVEREIELVEETEGYEPYCSECGAAAAESFLCFCPKCGADMRDSLKKDGEQE